MKVDAILTSDIHLRDTVPICRTDDFIYAMWDKLAFIFRLADTHNCPIIDSGDLFHTWKGSNSLLSRLLFQFGIYKPFIYTVPGNHDMPNHNIKLLEKSALNVFKSGFDSNIEISGKQWGGNDVFLTRGFCYGTKLENPEKDYEIKNSTFGTCYNEYKKVALVHEMIWEKKKPHPNVEGIIASDLMEKLSDFDLIVCGHNHETFIVRNENQLLVNPGSMMRSTTKQINHIPKVFLWNAEFNKIEEVIILHEKNVISTEHIEEKQKKEDRIESFIERLKTDYEIDTNFEENLKTFFQKNKIRKPVQNIIMEEINAE